MFQCETDAVNSLAMAKHQVETILFNYKHNGHIYMVQKTQRTLPKAGRMASAIKYQIRS